LIVEGDGEEVTTTVVCATDPLARVTEACVVLTTGGGVVTVTIVEVLGGMGLGVEVELGVVVVVVFDVVVVVVVILHHHRWRRVFEWERFGRQKQ